MVFLKKIKSEYLLLVFILVICFFMRFYHIEQRVGFSWDEETIAWKVKSILVDHKLTLIGMKAGEFAIFTGPALIYILCFVYLIFSFNPIGVVISAAVLSLVTTILFYLLGSRIFSKQIGLMSALVFGGSYFLSNYDRSWLLFSFFIISLLIFYFLYMSLKTKKITFLVFLSLFTGYSFQVHITAIFFPVIIVASFLLLRPKFKLKAYFISIIIFLISFIPIILFDLRHDFLNTRGILKLLVSSGQTHYLVNAKKLVTLLFENSAAVFMPNFPKIALTISAFLLIFILVSSKLLKEAKVIILLWLLIPLFLLLPYKNNIPEYYLMATFPVLVFLGGIFGDCLFKFNRIIFVLLIVIFLGFNLKSRFSEPPDPYGLQVKNKIINEICNDAGNQNFNVYYFSRLGLDNGFSYLFWYKKSGFSETEAVKKYTIMMPKEYYPQKADFSAGYIGVLKKQLPGARQIVFDKI